jgi:uncharacterized coiled-coil protein SlyX
MSVPARLPLLIAAMSLALPGCGGGPKPEGPSPAAAVPPSSAPPEATSVVVRVDTVRVPDPEADARVAQLELQLLERKGQIEELQNRLDDARREVVRAMAKLQTLATRAEAASGMAEAELALQALRTAGGSNGDVGQAKRLLDASTAEFNKTNYAGALYMATQSKTTSVSARGRLDATPDRRPGEKTFAAPVRLAATGRTNVREGPGTGFRVVYTVEAGTQLTGYSYTPEWIRVTDEAGRGGWIIRTRVNTPADS